MASQKRSSSDLFKAALDAGEAIQERDRYLEERVIKSQVTSLPLQKIFERTENTRELNQQHADDLMASISVLGLLEPLVVDARGRLLAGGHRRQAISQLREQMPDRYAEHFPEESIPVRSIDFDADLDPDLALNIEVAENEKRRDYTRAEVKKLAEKLKSVGYVDTKGRPASGEKALRPALEIIIGKSQRTVRRYLNEDKGQKSRSTDLLFSETTALLNLHGNLNKWRKIYGAEENETIEQIDREVGKLLKKLEIALKKSRKQEENNIEKKATNN